MDIQLKINLGLAPQKAHLWYCDFDKSNTKIDYYTSLLSDDEKLRSTKFKFEKDQRCYIISRGILRILLGRYLQKKPTDIIFEYTSYEKPVLATENPLKFNVSHSGNMAVFGFVNDFEIGVDIEKIKQDFDVMDIASNFFSADEIMALKRVPEHEQKMAFFRCWTRKESFIKAEGSGLSFPLDQFAVSLNHDQNAELLKTHWDISEKDKWNLFSFVPDEEYIGALAVKGPIEDVEYFDWDKLGL